MRHKGTITHWNDEKGFGFITPDNGGNKVFIHANSLTRQQARPQLSDIVTYDVKTNDKNKLSAINIQYQESPIRFSTLNERVSGTITNWNDEKGFGFITSDKGSDQIFFHINALPTGQPRPQVSDAVTYEIGSDDQRRLCAINVQYKDYRLGSCFLNSFFLGANLVFYRFILDSHQKHDSLVDIHKLCRNQFINYT